MVSLPHLIQELLLLSCLGMFIAGVTFAGKLLLE
jgi:hypothetical protein